MKFQRGGERLMRAKKLIHRAAEVRALRGTAAARAKLGEGRSQSERNDCGGQKE